MNKNNDFEPFDYEDEFDQEEFKRISELAFAHTRKFVALKIAENQDKKTKTVGDKVKVWDCSRLTDFETGELSHVNNVHQTLNKTHSIVIEDKVNHKVELSTFAGDFSKNLDLIIWNKKLNMRFRTSSDFVKLV